MTFEEVEKTLPNGFHDAKIVRMTLDYPAGTLSMSLQILVGTPGEADQEEYGLAELRANGRGSTMID
jgi:hypothetical protein